MIRRANGDTEVIDYRERAPLAATREMYLDKDGNVIKGASTVGYKAAGLPGTIAGLSLALKRHGKLKWPEVVEPLEGLQRTDSRSLSHRSEPWPGLRSCFAVRREQENLPA